MEMTPDEGAWNTRDEAALKLHCAERTVRRLIARGELRRRKVGSRVYITDAAIAEYLERGQESA